MRWQSTAFLLYDIKEKSSWKIIMLRFESVYKNEMLCTIDQRTQKAVVVAWKRYAIARDCSSALAVQRV